MAFRLLFWRRPRPETAGRHVRATALAVPDSTSALGAPGPADDNQSAPDIAAETIPAASLPISPPPVAPVCPEPQRVPEVAPSVPVAPQPEAASTAVLPVADQQVPSATDAAAVALGFADGASVELHPDDPRVTIFRAAAAALLDAPKA